jgi:hypothetical protein
MRWARVYKHFAPPGVKTIRGEKVTLDRGLAPILILSTDLHSVRSSTRFRF